jgi:hypothetical protein
MKSSYIEVASRRKKFFSVLLILFIFILGSAGALSISGAYREYKILKEIEKLSPYEKEVFSYQLKIKSGEILKVNAKLTVIEGLDDAKKLDVNKGKTQLSKDISDLLEANEFWWVEDNQLTIIIGNYRNEVVSNLVFSLQKGKCDTASGEITHLNLNFGDHPLDENSRIAYIANLPFNYNEKFGAGLNCGLIISAIGR